MYLLGVFRPLERVQNKAAALGVCPCCFLWFGAGCLVSPYLTVTLRQFLCPAGPASCRGSVPCGSHKRLSEGRELGARLGLCWLWCQPHVQARAWLLRCRASHTVPPGLSLRVGVKAGAKGTRPGECPLPAGGSRCFPGNGLMVLFLTVINPAGRGLIIMF